MPDCHSPVLRASIPFAAALLAENRLRGKRVREICLAAGSDGPQILRLKAERVSHSQIARRLGIGRTSVRRILAAG